MYINIIINMPEGDVRYLHCDYYLTDASITITITITNIIRSAHIIKINIIVNILKCACDSQSHQ